MTFYWGTVSIDIERYLKKFIDFSMVLDNGIVNEFYREKYKKYFDKFDIGSEYVWEIINTFFSNFFEKIDIRRQEKIMEKANMVHSLVCNKKLDISVLIFEVIYEVLKLLEFKNLQYVALINDNSGIDINVDIAKQIGVKRMQQLEEYANNAYDISGTGQRNTKYSLFGRVFWYFANIFYVKEVPYTDSCGYMRNYNEELEVAKKYCEFCEIIK